MRDENKNGIPRRRKKINPYICKAVNLTKPGNLSIIESRWTFMNPPGDPRDSGDQYNNQKNQVGHLGDKNAERTIEIGPKSANNKNKDTNTSMHNNDAKEEDSTIIQFVYNNDGGATQEPSRTPPMGNLNSWSPKVGRKVHPSGNSPANKPVLAQ